MERVVGGELDPDVLADLKLVVTELVDNAYIHGQGRIWMTLEPCAGSLRVAVIDEGRGATVRIKETGDQFGGFGLRLVDEVSTAWGAYEGTTHVWADVPVRGPRDR